MKIWTKKNENEALNTAKEMIQRRFVEKYGIKPTKKSIVPLEASYHYDKECDVVRCDNLGFHINGIGFSWRIGHSVEKNEAYDMAR